MAFNYRQGRRLYEAAKRDRTPDRFFEEIGEALQKKEIRPTDFSIRQLFETFVDDGREAVDSWNPRHGGKGVMLRESGVETSAFSNITGQIVYTVMMEWFDNPEFIGSRLTENVPTVLSGEKIAGVSLLGDQVESIGENQPYPRAGVSEDWIETPETTKRGVIVPVTKEAIFFDRTGQVLQHASQVSESMAINKEKRILDAVLGITSLYNRKGRGVVATYGDNSGSHDWDNLQASNALVDWTDIENAELLFDAMTDPNTGEPIMVMPKQIIVPSALKHTARRILNATEIRFGDGASSTTQTVSANPVAGSLEIISTAYVKARTSSDSTWFIGDFARGFKYMENWPATVVEAPPNSAEEFDRDVAAQFKISERGTPAVTEPRYAVKCTA